MSFSDEEVDRYARHLVLREIGGAGQQALKAASILIVGAGGLGAPAALYLAAAGVGRIGLVDPDTVALSNLQRQILYTDVDVGRIKVEAAAERLAELNAHVAIEPLTVRIGPDNARALVRPYDLVLDRHATISPPVSRSTTPVWRRKSRWSPAPLAAGRGRSASSPASPAIAVSSPMSRRTPRPAPASASSALWQASSAP